jgi:putative copper export protein
VPALLRGLALAGLLALAGVLGFLAWPRPRGESAPRGARRLATAVAVGAPLLVGLHAAAWLMTVSPDHRLTGDAVAAAVAGGTGRVELYRAALALLALWAMGLARRPGLALLFAAGALVVSGAAGHPAAISPVWAVPAKALHLLAGAAWLGGLLWLLATGLAAREAGDVAPFEREAARVSAVALGAVVVVALSGVAQALLFLPSPRDLVRSAYGALVLAKAAGLLALVGFGAYHRSRVLPRLARPGVAGGFAVTLRREVALMTLVILLGGLLAYVPPPPAAPAAPNAPNAPGASTHTPSP